MSKYCPNCGKLNNDLLQSCWNCGEYIGRGRVEDLRTAESARQVQSNLKLEKRDVSQTKPYMSRSDSDIGLVTIYGVTKKDLEALLTQHKIEVDQADTPGLCKSDEMMTQGEMRRQEANARSQNSVSGYSGSGPGSYYYSDPSSDYCCYYCCAPRPYYGSSSGCSSSSSGTRSRGSSSDCNCNDSGSDNDVVAAILVALILVAVVAVLIALGPVILSTTILAIDVAISVVLLLFNVLTLGIYRDDLSRQRLRIRSAEPENLNAFLKDLVAKKGLPRMPGYWSQGFMFMRYGALVTMTGFVVIIGMYFLDVSLGKVYIIPAMIIVAALFMFFGGNYAKNQKIAQVRQELLKE